MQNIFRNLSRLSSFNNVCKNDYFLQSCQIKIPYSLSNCNIHISSQCNKSIDKMENNSYDWLKYNEKIFPVQAPNEERRPAFVCHMKANVKYSPKKMWYVAGFVRGMTVDEAVKQLSFLQRKGAMIAKETILEAQKLAVEEHNVEFKSNLWVAESFATKGIIIKGIRRHAKARVGNISYRYCNYFVRLEEGKPPKHFYVPAPKSPQEMLEFWMEYMRQRKVHNSL